MSYATRFQRWLTILLAIFLLGLLPACSIQLADASSVESFQQAGSVTVEGASGSPTVNEAAPGMTDSADKDVQVPSSEGENVESPTATAAPEPEAINPLTGLPVDDAEVLLRRPLLVSISNFPPSARPQAGLSFASHVYSTFIGFGMNRYIAVFYGDYAEHLQEILSNRLAAGSEDNFAIGPIRSGRVAFEDIKNQYPHALLITAGASPQVLAQFSNQVSVFGSGEESVNDTGVGANALSNLASDLPVDPITYESLVFDPAVPDGGEPAEFVRIIYNYLNQNGWDYDTESGTYLRLQDQADGSGELFPMTDRLTEEQLAFENVVVLWAEHSYISPTIVEINLSYVWDQFGLLYRDGKIYEIKWSTRNGELTLYDGEGEAVPLKPGKTWFEVVSFQSTWDRAKSIVRFHEPPSDF